MDGIKEVRDRGNEEDEGGDRDGDGEEVGIALLDDDKHF